MTDIDFAPKRWLRSPWWASLIRICGAKMRRTIYRQQHGNPLRRGVHVVVADGLLYVEPNPASMNELN